MATFETLLGLRYLRSRKRSAIVSIITVISISGVALGVATLIVVLSVMSGFEADLKSKILGANAHLVVLKAGLNFNEHEEVIEKVRQVDGVIGAAPFILSEVMASTDWNTAGVLVKGVDPGRIDVVSDLRQSLKSGKLEYLAAPDKIPPPTLPWPEIPTTAAPPAPPAARSGPDAFADDENGALVKPLPAIIIGQELARSLRLYVGDTMHIISPLGDGTVGPTGPIPKARTFRVAGIFYSGFYEFDAKLVYVNWHEAQDFFGLGAAVSGIECKVRDIAEARAVAERVHQALGGFPYRTRDWQQMNKNLFSALKLEKLVMFIILIFIVLVASFNIISTLYMFVSEKDKEIAILKSMGASDFSVQSIFMRIGLIIGGVGTAFGAVAGFVLCLFVRYYGIHLDPDVYYLDQLPVVMNPLEFFEVGLAAIAISFLATMPPSFLASRMKPVDGLRYD